MIKLFLFRFLYSMRPKNSISIATAVSLKIMFQESEVELLYEKVHSWDMVLATGGYAGLMGIGNLTYAFEKMREHHPEASAEKLYKMYGII